MDVLVWEQRTKKLVLAFFAVFVAMLVLAGIAAQPAHAAKPTIKTIRAEETSYVDNSTVSTKFNLYGGKKKEKIRVQLYGKDDNYYTKARIQVNGKTVLTKKEYGYIAATVKLIRLKNGKRYVYLCLGRFNLWNGGTDIYKYKHGKLKRVVNLNKRIEKDHPGGYHVGGYIAGVSGNKIRVRCEFDSQTEGFDNVYYRTYVYKHGKLRLKK
ncbi:MAG: hypothetical protein ACOX69_08845 [Coriobacteriales bacterium]